MPSHDIDAVLSASNHYEALGIEPDEAAEGPKLRKAYLRRSVQVHPDKNGDDPRAAQAFQRVTLAYNVLSNEQSRSHYEKYGEEEKSSSSSDNREEETYYARAAPPSYHDAMFVFAAVASMMGGVGGGCGQQTADMAQAMYFAETFLRNDRSIDLSDGKAKAHAAMGAGATLRVVGSAVRAAGFKKSAGAIDSAASLLQAAGIGAMVADTPAVKKALEEPSVKRTVDAGSQKLGQLGAAARQAMGKKGGDPTTTASSESRSTYNNNNNNNNNNPAQNTSFDRSAEPGKHGDAQQTKSSGIGLGAVFAAAMGVMGASAASQTAADSANRSAGESASGFSSSTSNAGESTRGNNSKDDIDDHIAKAKAAGATAGSLRKGAEAAKKAGFTKQAAELEHAAEMAEMAAKAAKLAENPLVKSALKQPMVKRMVEASGQRLFEEAMKQGTSKRP